MLASLRFRILLAVAIALLSASLIGAILARNSAERLAQNLQDQNLRAMAFGFFSSVTASQGHGTRGCRVHSGGCGSVLLPTARLQGSHISGYNFVQVPVEDEPNPGCRTLLRGSMAVAKPIAAFLRAF